MSVDGTRASGILFAFAWAEVGCGPSLVLRSVFTAPPVSAMGVAVTAEGVAEGLCMAGAVAESYKAEVSSKCVVVRLLCFGESGSHGPSDIRVLSDIAWGSLLEGIV